MRHTEGGNLLPPTATPQFVVDAIYVIAEHLKKRGYESAVLWPNGGCSFRLHDTLIRESELLAIAAKFEEVPPISSTRDAETTEKAGGNRES